MTASQRLNLRVLALAAATAAATTAVVVPLATAQSAQSAAPAPQLVAGLPDFTRLVDEVGPAVVNIEAKVTRGGGTGAQPALPDGMPEIFRRFFGPGFQLPPGMEPGPGGPGPRGGSGTSLGSGFIISGDGYVLTNHHVVDGADAVTVKLSDRREFRAKVVGSDAQSDVALLKIDAARLPALRIGDSNTLKPGQWVVAIGSPFGLDHSVTAGVVSAVGRSNPFSGQQYVPFIQTDVAINRGNSGGPLLDTRGQVVGINSQIFSNSGGYMGVSFAIPIDVAMNAVNQIKAGGKVRYGMIGVGLQGVDADVAKAYGLPDTRGAIITGVNPGSAGERAGLRTGDVIRSVDGRAINDSSELPPIIGAKPPGTRVRLGILRDGKPRDVDVVLGQLDERALAVLNGDDEGGPAPPAAARAANALGIVGEALDAADRRQLGLRPDEGVGIARVDGSAAREAGLRPGDVVLQVGKLAVGTPAALDRALATARSGEPVMLLVRRGGNTQFITVTPRGE